MASKKNVESEVVETESVETVEVEAPEVEAKPEPEPVDLTGFQAAVDAAIEAADETTGVIPEVHIEAVKVEYQKLDGARGKTPAKAIIAEGMTQAVQETNIAKAQAYMVLQQKAAVAAAKAPAAKKVVDPTEAAVEHLASIYLAGFLAGETLPEGLDAEEIKAAAQGKASEEFATTLASLTDETVEASALGKRAVRISETKVKGAGRSGIRRDLGAHIQGFIDTLSPNQFATVAQIRSFESGIYGSERPSAGAISNRLEPKSGNPSTLTGVSVERRDGKLGIVKN